MKRIQKALAEVLDISYSMGINIILMGEISLYLHGIDIKPSLIEAIIDDGAVYLFEERIKKSRFKVIRNMNFYSEGECYSLSAVYMIYGVKVHIYASLTFRHSNVIEKFVLRKILPMCEYKYLDKMEFPITSLELELILSFLREKRDYIEIIIKRLKKKNINFNYINAILNELPLEKKNEIINYFEKYGLDLDLISREK